MVRPQINRRVEGRPIVRYFKPQGLPLCSLEELGLTEDGLEAIRLADLEGLYHEEAAKRMGISRPTFGRVLTEARRVVAEALSLGKALRIEGGQVEVVARRAGGRGRCRRRGGA